MDLCNYVERAEAESLNPVRPGNVNGQAFWNHYASRFMYAPAFDFFPVDGAAKYRYTVTDRMGRKYEFEADVPHAPLSPVWSRIPAGRANVAVDAFDAAGKHLGRCRINNGQTGKPMQERPDSFNFYRNVPFCNGYPPKTRSYAEAAKKGLEYIFNLSYVQYLKCGKPDPAYTFSCYPSKILSAIFAAMADYAEAVPEKREEALDIARKAADYLIGKAVPAGEPLEYLPMTYEGSENAAERCAGTIMMLYPASVGMRMVRLAEVTGDGKYLEYAARIADQYLRLQQPCGSWYLVYRIESGTNQVQNFCEPTGIFLFLQRMAEKTGNTAYSDAVAKGVPYYRRMIDTFNWEGQFEDVPPAECMYCNLSKHMAADPMMFLLKWNQGDARTAAEAREAIRFCEDQFIVWEQAGWIGTDGQWTDNDMQNDCWGWFTFHTPAVLEQYRYYTPVDASLAKMIHFYLSMFDAEKDPMDLAKARALGDSLTRLQNPATGHIPTSFGLEKERERDWVNCTYASILALKRLAEYEAYRA